MPAVCVLDTGVNRGHALLEGALAEADCHACESTWGFHDHHGHGTEMAGLALYGDLVPVLSGSEPVYLRHRLESVKILPPKGENSPTLYGTVTADATARVEIQAPERCRCFSMSIAAKDERDRGQPSSWSAAVDALAAGRSFNQSSQGLVYFDNDGEPPRRLFVVCAGNVEGDSLQTAHLDRSDTESVHDPAQAWNALTVGAFTEKAVIQDSMWGSGQPVARPGDLSPWSTTGVIFEDRWPIKPDVVFEGGNVVKTAKGTIEFPYLCEDLCLLSTNYKPSEKPFVLTWATSAATAQVARMAAIITAEYPTLWPETVRALIVHSAEWTHAMRSNFDEAASKRARTRLVRRYGFGVPRLNRARTRLVRRYGFGVPRLNRALHSASDSLTLIAQGIIRPFAAEKLREMHLFELPWPKSALESLGETPVRLRVTLSYFIEPNPGRRGWKNRYRYASHGLRFDVKGPTESTHEFHKRLNRQALEEDEDKPSSGGDSAGWFLGERARSHGSIHSDIWEGMAVELAERGVVGIYPVSGWWKDQPKRPGTCQKQSTSAREKQTTRGSRFR